MGKNFKVEIRKNCKECGNPLPTVRHRTYCSAKCRNRTTARRYNEYKKEWQKKARDKLAVFSKDKIQCLICGRWYRQVGSHIVQIHKITAREYREQYGFDVKKGQVSDDLRKLYREQVIENGTVKNLKAGKKFRFVKGDSRAGIYKRSIQTVERLKKQIKQASKKIKKKL